MKTSNEMKMLKKIFGEKEADLNNEQLKDACESNILWATKEILKKMTNIDLKWMLVDLNIQIEQEEAPEAIIGTLLNYNDDIMDEVDEDDIFDDCEPKPIPLYEFPEIAKAGAMFVEFSTPDGGSYIKPYNMIKKASVCVSVNDGKLTLAIDYIDDESVDEDGIAINKQIISFISKSVEESSVDDMYELGGNQTFIATERALEDMTFPNGLSSYLFNTVVGDDGFTYCFTFDNDTNTVDADLLVNLDYRLENCFIYRVV